MKFLGFGFLIFVSVFGAACNNKPAYSNINVNRARSDATAEASANEAQAANPEQPPGADKQPPASDAANATPPPAGAPPSQEVKTPAFLDAVKGEAKDLPGYPNGVRRSFMVGPVEGQEILGLTLESGDPIEKIAAFYDKTIRANKWTVLDSTRDPEFTEWVLKKGETSEGKVQIRKNPAAASYFIVIARTEKQAPSKSGDTAK
jgi:hypothetical protein